MGPATVTLNSKLAEVLDNLTVAMGAATVQFGIELNMLQAALADATVVIDDLLADGPADLRVPYLKAVHIRARTAASRLAEVLAGYENALVRPRQMRVILEGAEGRPREGGDMAEKNVVADVGDEEGPVPAEGDVAQPDVSEQGDVDQQHAGEPQSEYELYTQHPEQLVQEGQVIPKEHRGDAQQAQGEARRVEGQRDEDAAGTESE